MSAFRLSHQNEKRFRYSSTGLRRSVRNEMQEKFNREESLFYEVFDAQGYKPDSVIRQDSPILGEQGKQQEVFVFFLKQIEEKCSIATVDMFVSYILKTIRSFHLDNSEDQIEIDTLLQYRRTLIETSESILTSIRAFTLDNSSTRSPQDIDQFLHQHPSYAEIFHIANPANHSSIFNFYQIKYRARLICAENNQEIEQEELDEKEQLKLYKSLYEEKSQNRWRESFSENVTHLEIIVLGKLRSESHQQQYQQLLQDFSNSNGDQLSQSQATDSTSKISSGRYAIISRVLVNFDLIYACIHPRLFEQKNVPAKVNIQFKDQTESAPFTGVTNIEMGFNFVFDNDTKLAVIERMQDHYNADLEKLQFEIKERHQLINDILTPFQSKIVYKPGKGLEEYKNTNRRRGACTLQSCSIF